MPDQSPFDVLEASFRLLSEGPSPLAVHGRDVGAPLPPRPIPVAELGPMLLHPAVPYDARDRAVRLVLRRAQDEGGPWVVALAGLLLPGLRAALGQYQRAYPSQAEDLEADALAELVAVIDSFDPSSERIASRLLWRAAARARRRLEAEQASAGRRVPSQGAVEPGAPWGHPEFVLRRAVAEGVVTADDAELVAETRLGGTPLREWARHSGERYDTVNQRRYRAERRIARWLTGREVACQIGASDASFLGASRSPTASESGPGRPAHTADQHPREVDQAPRPALAAGAARPADDARRSA